MTASLTFDAGLLARGWLATHLATGSDETLPILCGTLLIESYSDGIRVTATDRYMILTSWISAADRDPENERLIDESPDSVTVVRDPDGRGKALLTYLRKLAAKAAKDEVPAPIVALHIGVPADDGDEPGFPGMELQQVVIDYPEHEKLALPIVQGEFPTYRAILLDHEPAATGQIALGADLVARLGQVGKVTGGFVQCRFSGEESFVAIEVAGAAMGPAIRGGVMPIRLASLIADAEDAA